MDRPIRILFVADSHLGLDLPVNPRAARRRRGHDFLANHEAALAAALAGEADLVVHGGDVFDRPRVDAGLAHRAYAPLLRVADAGVPVFVVPGNHERGMLPHARFLAHPRVHVFDTPRTFVVEVGGRRLALSGFPYTRQVRSEFASLVERTGWRAEAAALRLLCVHHCVEGATVGPSDFTFTTARDVIRGRDLPVGFAALLSGHIHRHQVLTRDLAGRPLPMPVLYPGSIERTSTAEIGERKGYLMVELDTAAADVADARDAGDQPDAENQAAAVLRWRFVELPARPMRLERIAAGDAEGVALDATLRAMVASMPPDAVLLVRVEGDMTAAQLRVISASHVRSYAPPAMNVEVRAEAFLRAARGGTRAASPVRGGERDDDPQLGLL
jgi:DNA repair protein SbcD/Mre11